MTDSPTTELNALSNPDARRHVRQSTLAGWGRAVVASAFSLATAVRAAGPAHCEGVRAGRQDNVEYLVGGGGEQSACSDGASSGGRRTTRPSGKATRDMGEGDARSQAVLRPDEQGRREILNQELDAERRAIAQLAASAGGISEEGGRRMARHQANVTALEAELRRLKQ